MNTPDKVIKIALDEVGYLEKSAEAYKRDPSILDEKKEGAGQDNYTKYGRDMHALYPSVMDFPAYWCDAFVDWCFYKAYGVATAKSLVGGNFDDYTVQSAAMYNRMGALDEKPSVGAQVFFTKNGKINGCYHTGIVVDLDGTYFFTVEGNTSTGAVNANGGGVVKKMYKILSQKGKVLFGHPRYDITVTKRSTELVAEDVLAGKYGTGQARKQKLAQEGYDPAEIQRIVNKKLGAGEKMADHVSQKGIDLIKSFESCKLKAYRLPGETYYTIGWGRHNATIKEGMTITQETADRWLKEDLVKFEDYVKRYATIPLTQSRLDALTSYTYNRGPKGMKELALISNTPEEYADNMVLLWGSAQKFKAGLIRRRKAERELFLNG
jgi:GH24 family phage-related lysozyme (muramidase)